MSQLYVFDSNSLHVFGNYYPKSFPSFWERLAELTAAGDIISVREVKKELEFQNPTLHVLKWSDDNKELFSTPSTAETDFVAEIFRVRHFQQLIGQKQMLRGYPVVDPFVVARGKVFGACVVTEEAYKPNAAKIPNVCERFDVRSTNVQGFLNEVGWRF
ncbi:MAG: DUF4411 family protein [Coriobacteriia bacterium]|nr:DUF4411 family protein [Coriobacteriia bacterium]